MVTMLTRFFSFIHIPGSIFFLAWLYHYAPPRLYQARRRTLATCNLIAFIVFTLWPCMPPRLLPEEEGFGFIDTVHKGQVASVWTTNMFCNQLGKLIVVILEICGRFLTNFSSCHALPSLWLFVRYRPHYCDYAE